MGRARLLLAAGLLAACHAPAGEGSSSSTTRSDEGTTTAGTSTTAVGTSTSTSTGGEGSGSASTAGGEASTTGTTGGEATREAGTTDDASSSGTTGEEIASCKKLDVLFLIVDGGDLWDTRTALHKLMPHLGQRLAAEFADWDYHVLVANPDGHWGNKYCEALCDQGEACETLYPYPCGVEPSACDLTRGAGVTFPAGNGASNVPCPIDGDQRYIVRGQEDLTGALSCVGRVGGGYGASKLYEVARATLDAIDTPLNAPGACNEGFFREDAYLILFVVSAYPDILSEGTPADWTKELKGHKGGKFDKIYFIGLFNGCDSGIGWKHYQPLFDWAESFYYHETDDACAATVIPYMDPALDYVLGDCQE